MLVEPLRQLERSLTDRLNVPLLGGPDHGLSGMLLQIAPQVRAAADWDWVVERYLAPPLQQWVQNCQEVCQGDSYWEEWQQRYFQTIRTVLENLERYSLARQQKESDRIRSLLEECGYSRPDASLSQIAMSLLLNLQGVSCVLNGMRRPPYVQDAMGAPELPPVDALSILQEFSRRAVG